MVFKTVKDAPLEENPHGVEVRKLYDQNTAQAMHITLKPGQSLKPHITPVDVFFYVLEGTPDIRIGNETVGFEKDSLVESPKEIVHCISNPTDTIARILVVKAPKQTGKAILL
jgi:mannose-6-phosphate isomerase-like protein (cupin superfamily)